MDTAGCPPQRFWQVMSRQARLSFFLLISSFPPRLELFLPYHSLPVGGHVPIGGDIEVGHGQRVEVYLRDGSWASDRQARDGDSSLGCSSWINMDRDGYD